MFSRTVVARVGLPRSMWEPIRKLRDSYDVPLDYLAQSWGVDTGQILRVLYAARLVSLENGEEIAGAEFMEQLVSDLRD